MSRIVSAPFVFYGRMPLSTASIPTELAWLERLREAILLNWSQRRIAAELAIDRETVSRYLRLAEAPSYGKPIHFYDIHSKGAEAYTNLAREVITSGEKRIGKGAGSSDS